MKLVFYPTGSGEVELRAALPTRQWMDETHEAFAYRCLPLNIANAHGWELLSPCAFSARWDGGMSTGAVDVRGAADAHVRPTSIFGHGVLTFHVRGLFRTEPGWNLFVGGPPNQPKDAIYPLSGVIETDWAPYSFTMNWRFTRPDHWICFEQGEPFCFVFPVQRGLLQTVEPEIRDLSSEPALRADYDRWSQERRAFHDRLMVKDSPETRMRWQKRYYRGLTMHDQTGIEDHEAKLRVAEFRDVRRRDADSETPRLRHMPEFFRKVVPLSRVKHAKLGLRRHNYAFAAATALIPVAAVEFAAAGANYPLAFSGTNPPRPVCVVGGLPGINLQVDGGGNWLAGCYVPAAVRRFPFITLSKHETPDVLTLGIEVESELLDPAAPDKLFDRNGEMSELCRERLRFAAKLATEFEKTEALCDALPADLLMQAQNVAPSRLAVRSIIRDLRVIDPQRLRLMPEQRRMEWEANGWLAALEALVASARNWAPLLAQEDEMSAALVKPKEPV